jgi:hypothetical protein
MSAPLDSMLEHLFNLLLLKEFDPDLIEPAGEALLSLSLLRQPTYGNLVQTLLEHQQSPEQRQRLQEAFEALGRCIQDAAMKSHGGVVVDKVAFRAFQEGLTRFLMNVRGFLRVR